MADGSSLPPSLLPLIFGADPGKSAKEKWPDLYSRLTRGQREVVDDPAFAVRFPKPLEQYSAILSMVQLNGKGGDQPPPIVAEVREGYRQLQTDEPYRYGLYRSVDWYRQYHETIANDVAGAATLPYDLVTGKIHRDLAGEVLGWDRLTPDQRAALVVGLLDDIGKKARDGDPELAGHAAVVVATLAAPYAKFGSAGEAANAARAADAAFDARLSAELRAAFQRAKADGKSLDELLTRGKAVLEPAKPPAPTGYGALPEVPAPPKPPAPTPSGYGTLPEVPVAPAAGKTRLDLMGGQKSKLGEGWTNFDRLATEGIADDVANLGKHFKPGQLAEVVANNPQAEFLPHVGPLVEQGGTVTVRGNLSNKFFNRIWEGKAAGLDGFEVVSKTENVPNLGYLRTDGTPVGGQIHEIVLRKK